MMNSDSYKTEPPEVWETAEKIECRCGMVYVRPKPTITPQQQAVINAVMPALESLRWFSSKPLPEAVLALSDALQVMEVAFAMAGRLKKLQPVKPETVEPGKEFLWPPGSPRHGDGKRYFTRAVVAWRSNSGDGGDFNYCSRIIPISEGEEQP